MKASVVLAIAGAVAVKAQSFPADFPACGVTCATNLNNMASSFGCAAGDIPCLCNNGNFRWGVHDCAVQACQDQALADIVINWGSGLCASAGAESSIPPSTATNTGGASASSSADGDVTPTPITTSTYTSTIGSGSDASTITGETTIFGISGIAGVTSVPDSTVTSALVSTGVSGSQTFTTTTGSTTFTTSATGSALSSAFSSQASEAATSSSSSAMGAQKTAAPIAGLLAAAGFAAALL